MAELEKVDFTKKNRVSPDGMIGWSDENSQKKAFAEYGRALDKVQLSHKHATAALSDTFRNIDGGTSIRSPFTTQDYDWFRGNEAVPRQERHIISTCMRAYEKCSIVRNIIDLMADFACQGIKISHRNKRVEKFYQAWWSQINGAERSERILNMLYRSGNVIVKRSTATMTAETINKFNKSVGTYTPFGDAPFYSSGPDLDIEEDFIPKKSEVPWVYTILNPATLHVVGEELNAFIGQPLYSVNIPRSMVAIINDPKTQAHKDLVDSMPADIRNGVRAGLKSIPLDPTKLVTLFYKKDDWRVWAVPMLYSVLDDLILLEKLKLADKAALDGAIQHIRIWKLGDMKEKIVPTEAAMAKLSDILLNNVGGGSMDLVWGPDISLEETSTEIQKFLGSEKYGPVLTSICTGLGIPLTMSGASSNSSYTNNFISLKTLVERLTYGRNVLLQMWRKEIAIVQKAMGFRYPAEITFDGMSLSDDASEKAIWIQLFDRNLVSIETMQEKFGQIPEIENMRIQKNFADMEEGTIPPKASPFTDSDPVQSLKKIALQNGFISPGDVGIKGKPMEVPGDGNTPTEKPKGQPQQGRPKNSTDKNGRKKRAVKPLKPSSKAEEFIDLTTWASEAQRAISEIINPIMLDKYKKKSLRNLSVAEDKELERFKFTVLYNSEPFTDITPESVRATINDNFLVYSHIDAMKDEFIKRFITEKGVSPTVDEIKQIQSFTYAVCMGDF